MADFSKILVDTQTAFNLAHQILGLWQSAKDAGHDKVDLSHALQDAEAEFLEAQAELDEAIAQAKKRK